MTFLKARPPPLRCCAAVASASLDDNQQLAAAGEACATALRAHMSPSDLLVVARPPTGTWRSIKTVWGTAWAAHKKMTGQEGGSLQVPSEWQNSEDGVRCALAAVGFVMMPSSTPWVETDSGLDWR